MLKNLLALLFVFIGFESLMAQDGNYDDYNFEIVDDDVFDLDYENSTTREPGDFPGAVMEEFSNESIDNFADEEVLFENKDGDAGIIDFGDSDDQSGSQIGSRENADSKKPQPNSGVKPETNQIQTNSSSQERVEGDVNVFGSSPEVVPVDEIGAVGQSLTANQNADPVQESPYAPLPEDTLAPPAPELPEANEFSGVPPIPGTRRIMATGEAPQTYRVRAGDTLFDICDQLLDEPNYWPKLWALNPEIRNPHFIYPGIKLRFYPGDDEMPPYLEVVKEQDIVPIDSDGLKQSELLSADIDNLLFEKYAPEVSPVEDAEQSDLESFAIDDQGGLPTGQTVSIVVPAFYFAEQIEPLGVVAGSREGWALSGDKDYFLFEAEGEVSAGTIYTVVRPSGIPDFENLDLELNYRYEFVAAAKVSRNLDEGFAEARVVYTRLGVKSGDFVIDYKTFKRNLSIASATVSGSGIGTVIGFEHPSQRIGGQGSLVFLSGSFSANSVIPIFNDVRRLNNNPLSGDYPETIRPVATVRVIESTPVATLGYIMNNTRVVRVGDFSGKG